MKEVEQFSDRLYKPLFCLIFESIYSLLTKILHYLFKILAFLIILRRGTGVKLHDNHESMASHESLLFCLLLIITFFLLYL